MLPLENRGNAMSTDQEYYARRAVQERESADRCDEAGARRIHKELADRYTQMARENVTMRTPAQQI